MSKASITVEGFVTKDPELRQHNGKSVLAVDIAHTPRKKDGDQWVDAGETLWFQASFWERDADAIAASVRKGTLVTVTGQPDLNVYQRQDGNPGVSVRIKFGTLGIIPRQDRQQPTSAPNTAGQPQWDTQSGNGAQTGARTGSWATAGQIADTEIPF
jgi:single stranded DNA-binding protein